METIYALFEQFLSSIGPFFLLLGLLIFVHELGHFLVAKMCGVRVETFSLGFGKKILKYKKGDTVYCISAIPLGGYVKMFGDDPTAELSEEEQKHSFLHKSLPARFAVVLAGPLMNLFFAIVLFGMIGWMGEPIAGPQLGDVSAKSEAFTYGFRSGDTIKSVNGEKVKSWKELKLAIEAKPNETLTFDLTRENTDEIISIKAETILKKNPFIFSMDREIGWIEGIKAESRAPVVAITTQRGFAAKAGIKNMDMITEINNKKIKYWRDLEPTIAKAISGSNRLNITVENQLDPRAKPRVIKVDSPKLDTISAWGMTSTDLVLYSIKPSSPAEEAGLKPGDRILALNSTAVNEWDQLLNTVKNWDGKEKTLNLKYYRDGQIFNTKLAPEVTEIPTPQGNFENRYAIGISPAILSMPNELIIDKVDGFGAAVTTGVVKSWEWTKLICISMLRLVQNEVSARNIGGVISIGRVASQSYELGWIAFLKMMGIISINLFLLNLLPVPVLDGGHLVFFTIEAVKGSPLSLRKMEMAQQVGLVLLLSLMVFALFNDIRNLLTAW